MIAFADVIRRPSSGVIVEPEGPEGPAPESRPQLAAEPSPKPTLAPARAPARAGRAARLVDALGDRPGVAGPGEEVVLAWNGGDAPVAEARALRVVLGATLAVLSLLAGVLTWAHPRVRLITNEGTVLPRGAHWNGDLLNGATPADLQGALGPGRRLALLRFNMDAPTLNARLATVTASSTPRGHRALAASIPRTAYARLILTDSGVASVREFAEGAYAVGAGPGRVRVVVPLTGRLYGRYAPFNGVRSGVPLAGTVTLVLARAHPGTPLPPGAPAWLGTWRLDSIAGDVLPPGLLERWVRLGVDAVPAPRVIVNGNEVPADSAVYYGYRRGAAYEQMF